jgi:hypothetical protein
MTLLSVRVVLGFSAAAEISVSVDKFVGFLGLLPCWYYVAKCVGSIPMPHHGTQQCEAPKMWSGCVLPWTFLQCWYSIHLR